MGLKETGPAQAEKSEINAISTPKRRKKRKASALRKQSSPPTPDEASLKQDRSSARAAISKSTGSLSGDPGPASLVFIETEEGEGKHGNRKKVREGEIKGNMITCKTC